MGIYPPFKGLLQGCLQLGALHPKGTNIFPKKKKNISHPSRHELEEDYFPNFPTKVGDVFSFHGG